MRRVVPIAVPILLCLILVMGGVCSGLCLAQAATDTAAHTCCHEKNHCSHPVPTMQSHQAVADFQTIPVILAEPHLAPGPQFSLGSSVVPLLPRNFSPTFRISVLRI
jgi:hypothetical protein